MRLRELLSVITVTGGSLTSPRPTYEQVRRRCEL